jgi:hypothetical protein
MSNEYKVVVDAHPTKNQYHPIEKHEFVISDISRLELADNRIRNSLHDPFYTRRWVVMILILLSGLQSALLIKPLKRNFFKIR